MNCLWAQNAIEGCSRCRSFGCSPKEAALVVGCPVDVLSRLYCELFVGRSFQVCMASRVSFECGYIGVMVFVVVLAW